MARRDSLPTAPDPDEREGPMSTQAPAGLEQHVADTVTALARTLYPHDSVPDAVYERVPATIAEAAREDAQQGRMIADGVADLDRRGEEPFTQRTPEQRLADAEAIAGSEFFALVRSTAVVEVYSDPATWRTLGYEGPSFAKGGYLRRGFDDLDWLPDLPQEG
jgi:Gluconate 2-dehydrogenase subunit 3